MDERRNFIIAMLLMGLILFGWPYVAERFFPAEKSVAEAPAASATTASQGPKAALPQSDAPAAPATVRSVSAVLAEGGRIKVRTPKLDGSINLKGARIDDMLLTRYRSDIAKNSPSVRLLSPAGTRNAYYASFGWAGTGVTLPDSNTIWQASGAELTPGKPVILSWNNGTGQRFEIALSIDEHYMITARQTVVNTGAASIGVSPYSFISRTGIPADPDSWSIHIGPMGVFNGSADYDWDYSDITDAGAKGAAFETTGGWLGFTDKYWLTALIPDQKTPIEAKFRSGKGDIYQAQMVGNRTVLIQPGKQATQTSRLFVGAKETTLLDDYVDNLGVEKFDLAIDWGWYRPIEKAFFYLLHKLFEFSGNFGVAIILLTLIIRLLMFPIAQKQFASMAAMRAIQPKQKEIQERFKDDKQRQQQEIMKMYKEEKVNPLAGCLPIFLQIPIFFALYKLLMLTIEMRHQPFVLWLKDLSAPDTLTPVNLFGLLPFDPPGMLHIGILPILLGVTMWVQQKLNPAPADPVQQQVFAILPWVMMFVMAPFAAGLQLYWTVNNIVSIAQQKWLYSRHPQLKQLAAIENSKKAGA